MASFFANVFACCFRFQGGSRRAGTITDIETPNERSHLIPAVRNADEYISPSPADALAVSQQKLKERLSNIVRSKEGKMVNVNSRLPFNLHNQKLSLSIDPSNPYSHSHSHSSSSRSASTSTTHHRPSHTLSPSPLSATPIGAVHAHVGAPLMPSLDHHHTSSSSSISALAQIHSEMENSRSSSIASRNTSIHDPDSSERSIRTPILNLRLVGTSSRGMPIGAASSSTSASHAAPRGRTKKKSGEVASPSPSTGNVVTGNQSPVTSFPEGTVAGEDDTPTPSQSQFLSQARVNATNGVQPPESGPESASVPVDIPATNPKLSISPASSRAPFTLQDTAPIVVSWGD